MTVCYARVSSHGQKKDLPIQGERLRQYCLARGWGDIQIIEDLGSGLNYRKKGLQRLLKLICQRRVGHLVLVHKDRLLRFGAELLFSLCRYYDTEVTILEDGSDSFEQQLCQDVLTLMTVFTARLYGARSHKNLKALK